MADPTFFQQFVGRSIVFALAALFVWTSSGAVRRAHNQRADAHARLERLETSLNDREPARADMNLEAVLANELDTTRAGLALQNLLSETARANDLRVASGRGLGEEAIAGVGAVVWIEARLEGDLLALRDLLVFLDQVSPLILVRDLEIEAGDAARNGSQLSIRVVAGRIVSQGENGS